MLIEKHIHCVFIIASLFLMIEKIILTITHILIIGDLTMPFQRKLLNLHFEPITESYGTRIPLRNLPT